ncbi:MAG: D-sedoheptulose-7-phosphate isomerase [Bacteroidia bacterium]
MTYSSEFRSRIQSSIAIKTQLAENEILLKAMSDTALHCIEAFRSNKKVLWCGNGGSAADAQHLAAELSGRFYFDRPPLFSEALHVNTSYTTAVANDYGYDIIYERMLEAMAQQGDVLIGLSTSGNSANVVRAFEKARQMGVITIGMTGETGGKMASLSDILLPIPSNDTPRIQECHMLVGHTICELIEKTLFHR